MLFKCLSKKSSGLKVAEETEKTKLRSHRLFDSRSKLSGRSPDEAAEFTAGISSLSDAITRVVTEIGRRLLLHTPPFSGLEKTRSSDCWRLIIVSQRLIRADLSWLEAVEI